MIQTATMRGYQLMQREGVRQFVKFCIIGCTSMIIDVGIAWVLTYLLHWHWIFARSLSFTVAVTNGFIWNSMWTFRGLGSGPRHALYMKFFAVNIIGLVMNILIMKSVFFMVVHPHRLFSQGNPPKIDWMIGTGIAVVIVSTWNFLANKKWTFVN